MKWTTVEDYAELSLRAARLVLDQVERKPASTLGLPTGNTPLGMYRELAATCQVDYFCFNEVQTFNLDEYVAVPSEHPGSFASFMHRNFLNYVDIEPGSVHIPTGDPDLLVERFGSDLDFEELLARECAWYEEEIADAGGLDLIVLGVGRNGHIAFNEPGTPFESRTHVVELDESTRQANAAGFPGEEVPRRAITMGLATIRNARRVVLLASGATKRQPLERLAGGEVHPDLPVSVLRDHPDVEVVTDNAASPDLEGAE
ncbi:MAG: glucosamine-6-phosphate deaminase [Acidobacteria bacterium]|nr:glucosamine-6-phosphate deaminase [Acidobacteriota bacterium]